MTWEGSSSAAQATVEHVLLYVLAAAVVRVPPDLDPTTTF